MTNNEKASLTDGLFTEEGEVSPFKLALSIIEVRGDARDTKKEVRLWGGGSVLASGLGAAAQLFHWHAPSFKEVEGFIVFQAHVFLAYLNEHITPAAMAAISKGHP